MPEREQPEYYLEVQDGRRCMYNVTIEAILPFYQNLDTNIVYFHWEMQVNSPESPLYQPTVFFPLEHFAKKGEEVRQLCLELCIDVPKCCT
jgi:hypothetical protein